VTVFLVEQHAFLLRRQRQLIAFERIQIDPVALQTLELGEVLAAATDSLRRAAAVGFARSNELGSS
jgi:hypothetical protein